MTAALAPLSAPLVVTSASIRLDMRCGRCGVGVAQLHLPPMPRPSTWGFSVRTTAKTVAGMLSRRVPSLAEPFAALLLADDPEPLGALLIDALTHRNDVIRCIACATVDPSLT